MIICLLFSQSVHRESFTAKVKMVNYYWSRKKSLSPYESYILCKIFDWLKLYLLFQRKRIQNSIQQSHFTRRIEFKPSIPTVCTCACVAKVTKAHLKKKAIVNFQNQCNLRKKNLQSFPINGPWRHKCTILCGAKIKSPVRIIQMHMHLSLPPSLG